MIDSLINNRVVLYAWRAVMLLSFGALIVWGVCTLTPIFHAAFNPPCLSDTCSRTEHHTSFAPFVPMYTTPIIIALSNRKKNGKSSCSPCTWQRKCGVIVAGMLALGVVATFIGAMG